MDTLEARNLNRLRRGKMMLEYGKVKKSYGIFSLLVIFAGWLGAHRFYLGHKLIGVAILSVSALILASLLFETTTSEAGVMFVLAGTLVNLFMAILFIELILMTWTVGRENARIQARLATEYGVESYKVIP